MTPSQRLALLSPDQHAQLERILLERAREPRSSASPARDSAAPFPLSPQQLRIWFLAQMYPDAPLYNEAQAVRIDGSLDVGALERALREIVQRHEALRVSIQVNGYSPSQQVRPEVVAAVLHVDLTEHPDQERALDKNLRDIHRGRFDLARDPLFRFALIRLGRHEHVLLLVMHHVICDASSFDILYRECAALYQAFSGGQASPLPSSAGSLRTIVEEQLAAHHRTYDVSLDYWRRQLEGVPELLELPADKPRPPVASYAGARHRFQLGPELTAGLRDASRQAGTTMFALFSAAFAAFLHRTTDRDDVLFGIPVTARDTGSAQGVVGCLVHTLPLRFRFGGDPAFSDLVTRAQQTTAEAYDHRGLPLERLVEALGSSRSAGHAPLVQVVLNWRARDLVPNLAEREELRLTQIPIHSGTAKFDFQARFREGETSLEGEIEYRTDLFEPSTISRLAGHFVTLLESVAEDVHRPVSQLALMDRAARYELLEHRNRTKAPYPQLAVHRIFEAVAGHSPDAVALVDEAQAITYNDLNRRANRLARRLRALHVYPDTTVGIAMPRRIDTVIATLAVLKAGGAYLPLDPGYPPDVLEFLVQDAGTTLVLTCEPLLHFPARAAPMFDVRDGCADESADNLDVDIGPDHLAYVMYTSGSTGRPKAVEIPHRGIVRLVFGQQYAAFGPQEVFLHLAPFSFDAATFEIWGALLHGARCVLFPEHGSALQHLQGVVRDHGITTVWLTASLFNTIVDAMPGSLRGVKQLLVGGEALSVGHVIRAMEALPGTVVINGYGPTESTTFTCCHPIVPGELAGAGSVPIGVPVANTEVYVLDCYRQPVPVGVPGELYIGGDGLARGYRNRPDITRETFVDHPFRPGARLYRSGDIVRWSPRGYLEFLGRADDQLKIRGFRIEPAEIAVALRSHPDVQDAHVTCVGAAGARTLAAYFVLRRQGAAGVALLREFLTRRLPAHMVPALLVEVGALPLTSNGKVDVRALPHPAAPSAQALEPPRDRVEQTLHRIWSDLLPEKNFGIRDSFFELGGHSLLAARLFLEIDARLGGSLPLATLFHAPTIEALAAALRGDSAAAWSPLVAIQPKGSKPPFFAVHGVGGNLLSYRALAKHLPDDQPFYGLQARGLDGKTPPHARVEDMAVDYLGEIRRIQPTGPYYLGGLSFGCPVALEMAQLLRSAGEEVALLALLDGGLRRAKDLLPRRLRLTRVALFQLSRLCMHVAALAKLRPRDMAGFFRRKGTTMARRVRSLRWQVRYLGYESAGAELPAHLRRVEEGAYLAAKRYQPRHYYGPAVLFRSVDGPKLRFVDEHMGWGIVIHGGLEVRRVPGDHLTMTKEPHVRALASELTAVLEVAQQRAAQHRRTVASGESRDAGHELHGHRN